jgi:hypothetical protein
MDAEVAAGWIGAGAAILGTVAGSGASLWATTRTLRHEATKAIDERRDAAAKLIDERGQTAGREALAEFYALRRHIVQWDFPPDVEARRAWFHAGEEMADKAEMTAGLIPQAPEVRPRLEEALNVTLRCMLVNRRSAVRSTFRSKNAVDHAIEILQAFLRGDPLPEPSAAVEDLRQHRAQYDIENPPDPD